MYSYTHVNCQQYVMSVLTSSFSPTHHHTLCSSHTHTLTPTHIHSYTYSHPRLPHAHTPMHTNSHTHNGQWTDAVPNPLFFSLKHMLTHPLTSSLIPRPHSQLFNVARQTHIIMGSLHSSQINHLLLYPSLWLLVPGLSSHFHYCFLYNHFLRSTLVNNIFEKWLQDFEHLENP